MTKKMTKKKPSSIDYQERLIERLKNRDYAIAYLNAALEELMKGDEESQKVFLEAARNVAQARGYKSILCGIRI